MVLELPDDIKDQVDKGPLKVQLEVDITEDTGWVEEVTMIIYTLHKNEKTWQEADDECYRNGGHLASVTSEEVHEILKELIYSSQSVPDTIRALWLGGKSEVGEWRWELRDDDWDLENRIRE